MDTLRRTFNAILSMILVATAAMAAGAAMMLFVLFLVGLLDWTGGQQVARFDSTGVAENGTTEQEAPKPFN